jgi:hypothetical protein
MRGVPRPTLSALAVLGSVLLGTVGCFDVHMVGAGTLVIDDFDDGNFQPNDPAFDRWLCFEFNPTRSDGYRCGHDSGDNSSYSLFLDATIDDPPDGDQQHGGAGFVSVGDTPQDLSQFNQLVFDVELESGNPPLPSGAQLQVQVGCATALADDGATHSDLIVVQDAGYTNHWQTDTLSLANFGPPAWLNYQVAGGIGPCLQRVDSIAFIVDAQVADGQSGSFTLHVDDILFR